jgi:hypothetical protein
VVLAQFLSPTKAKELGIFGFFVSGISLADRNI